MGAVAPNQPPLAGSRSYLGRSASVSVSRACSKADRGMATSRGRAEGSRGRSSAMTIQSLSEGPNISLQGVSRHDLDPSDTHRSQFAHLNESRHQKASPRPSESQRDQSEPAAMTTPAKTLEQSATMLMEKIVDPDNLVRAWNKVRSNGGRQWPLTRSYRSTVRFQPSGSSKQCGNCHPLAPTGLRSTIFRTTVASIGLRSNNNFWMALMPRAAFD